MTPTILLSDTDNGVLRLILNDPTSRNSLSEAMMAALEAALGSCEKRSIRTRHRHRGHRPVILFGPQSQGDHRSSLRS